MEKKRDNRLIRQIIDARILGIVFLKTGRSSAWIKTNAKVVKIKQIAAIILIGIHCGTRF
jgi:hypothetical protein